MSPQDVYEAMDDEEEEEKGATSNKGMVLDEDKYMIPGPGDGDNVSQFSQPEVDATLTPEPEANVGLNTNYDVPSRVLESTGDNLNAVPGTHGKRNSDAAPTLPSHYQRQPRQSEATVTSETAINTDTYERISYGKYARRFRRIGRCNIL